MVSITKNEALWLRKEGFAHKVKMSGTRRKYYCVEDYFYKFDADGTVIASIPARGSALDALYKHRESIRIK